MNAKVIAVWGANGSGKTTTAVNLAFSLSQRNFTVGLISSNIYYGEMQMLCGCNIPDDRGIYHALMGGETKNMLVQAGKTSVFVLSVPDKFDAMQLTTISAKSVKDMLDDANMRFDYLVIDGNTDLNNPISSLGMTEADKLLVVHRPSVNAHDKSCDLSAYKSSIGLTFDFELGYVENANIYANTGQAIVFHDLKQEREYISGMKALTSSVILGGGQ